MMDWTTLLKPIRQGDKEPMLGDSRSAFEIDFDRIVFSHPFRRLQDKTQVHPLPESDFVHNRLTHSLEVSSVARSLGKNAGKTIVERYGLAQQELSHHDIGAIVAGAALAHDVGNPPFGHSGEAGISDFFKNSETGTKIKKHITPQQWEDITHFEGNAQGFRILTHITKGLKLTYPVLAAFTKYPCASPKKGKVTRKSQKKYGFFQAEATYFEEMAHILQLTPLQEAQAEGWLRHPLAFLVEAADDICYSIIDLEDGCGLKLISYQDTIELLAPLLGDQFDPTKLARYDSDRERVGVLRAITINKLVEEVTTVFLDLEKKIMTGEFDQDLVSQIPQSKYLDEITRVSVQKIYRSEQVIQREAAGFEVLEGLMQAFIQAVYNEKLEVEKFGSRQKNVLRLLPVEYRNRLDTTEDLYSRILIITDFVSGLTDSNALRLFQIIKGIALPGLRM